MSIDSYQQLIDRKLSLSTPTGLSEFPSLSYNLFPHQDALVKWALRRGRSAIFADTGLGKTRMELAWSQTIHDVTKADVLILAPLAVATQSSEEGTMIGIDVNLCREDSDVRPGINITNYDRLHKFDTRRFNAVVLDESSCIKHSDSKTLVQLIELFAHSQFKLCATATPAPNDWTELGTHAEFLGLCKHVEMLAEYFVHDAAETQIWRLKGHARHQFWKWVSSWGAMIKTPADLGFDASAYQLPPLTVQEHIVESPVHASADLFTKEAQTLSERRNARRDSIIQRVAACAATIQTEPQEPWVVWCDLNAEGNALQNAIHDSVQIAGADPIDIKERRLHGFAHGEFKVLITKPSISGWGLNWQHCARQAFVGVTDSYEAYYQAVRRSYRFGQKRPVNVHLFASDAEGSVLANLKRKEVDAAAMAEALSQETKESVMANVRGAARQSNTYHAHHTVKQPNWLTQEEI